MSEMLTTPDVRQPGPETEAAQEAERPPTRELLPAGRERVVVIGVGAALLVASFVHFGLTGHAVLGAVFCPTLVLLAAIDLRRRILPNDIVGPAVLAVGLVVAAANPGGFLEHLAAAAALGGFFLAFALVFRGSLGLGDAKLGFLLGLALGIATFTATLLAFVGLLVNALWILARQGMSARRQAIAFGPYLALGGIVAYFLS